MNEKSLYKLLQVSSFQAACVSGTYVFFLFHARKDVNEERDRRLEVVKLPTALSYCTALAILISGMHVSLLAGGCFT